MTQKRYRFTGRAVEGHLFSEVDRTDGTYIRYVHAHDIEKFLRMRIHNGYVVTVELTFKDGGPRYNELHWDDTHEEHILDIESMSITKSVVR